MNHSSQTTKVHMKLRERAGSLVWCNELHWTCFLAPGASFSLRASRAQFLHALWTLGEEWTVPAEAHNIKVVARFVNKTTTEIQGICNFLSFNNDDVVTPSDQTGYRAGFTLAQNIEAQILVPTEYTLVYLTTQKGNRYVTSQMPGRCFPGLFFPHGFTLACPSLSLSQLC